MRIVLTGGGTAGHVTPNLAIVPRLKALGAEVDYIGSIDGMERALVQEAGLPYYGIHAGKLRRYFSLKNFTDPFKILAGYAEAKKLLLRLAPDAVFSKGGFVTVPVVYAAAAAGIPVILHESDYTPGLANRLSAKKAKVICVTFEDTVETVGKKAIFTGNPIRAELFSGSRERGLSFLGFEGIKPVLLIMGGSLGAVAVNSAVEGVIDRLLSMFDIVHIRGVGHINGALSDTPGYRQYEYVKEELPDVFAAADCMLSRAGANAVCEIMALNIPALLIPLSAASSRGDQILNAQYCKRMGYSLVLSQEETSGDRLIEELNTLLKLRGSLKAAMAAAGAQDAAGKIADIIIREAQCNSRKQ